MFKMLNFTKVFKNNLHLLLIILAFSKQATLIDLNKDSLVWFIVSQKIGTSDFLQFSKHLVHICKLCLAQSQQH